MMSWHVPLCLVIAQDTLITSVLLKEKVLQCCYKKRKFCNVVKKTKFGSKKQVVMSIEDSPWNQVLKDHAWWYKDADINFAKLWSFTVLYIWCCLQYIYNSDKTGIWYKIITLYTFYHKMSNHVTLELNHETVSQRNNCTECNIHA